MTERRYDELLAEALKGYKAKQLNSLPENKDIDYEFSEGFKRKMERLIKNQEKSYFKIINTTAKKAAIIIVSIIIGLSATLTIDAIREPIFNFFYEIFSTHTDLYPGKTEQQTSKTEDIVYYTLPEIPTSFKQAKEILNEFGNDSEWFNDDQSEMISLVQSIFPPSASIDSEKGEIKELIINDIGVLLCRNEHNYICTWLEHGYSFELIYPLEFGEEYAYKVVGKLKVLNNTKSHD